MRTIASQMKDAEGLSITVKINAQPSDGEPCTFVASGRTITFYGFLKAYVESVEETDGHTDDEQTRLPHLTAGQPLRPESVTASGHETRPPARYTEPSLVAKLEELEIGRPSTYATIIRTITARDYVFKKGTALVPTWLAFAVTRLLEEHFPKLVDYAFTAEMEEVLDRDRRWACRAAQSLDRLLFRRVTTAKGCTGWSPSLARSTLASFRPSRSLILTLSRRARRRLWSGSVATAPMSRMRKVVAPTSLMIFHRMSSLLILLGSCWPSRWARSESWVWIRKPRE